MHENRRWGFIFSHRYIFVNAKWQQRALVRLPYSAVPRPCNDRSSTINNCEKRSVNKTENTTRERGAWKKPRRRKMTTRKRSPPNTRDPPNACRTNDKRARAVWSEQRETTICTFYGVDVKKNVVFSRPLQYLDYTTVYTHFTLSNI